MTPTSPEVGPPGGSGTERAPAAPGRPDGDEGAATRGLEGRARASYPALRALCEAYDLQPDVRTVLRALSVASRLEVDAPSSPGDAPPLLRVLARALPEVGLRAYVGHGAGAALATAAARSGVCVALAGDTDEDAPHAVLGLVTAEGARVALRRLRLVASPGDDVSAPPPDDAEAPVSVDAGALAAALGAAPDASLWWISASPLLPLGALGPEGGEGHGPAGAGKDGHAPGGDAHDDGRSPFARLRTLARLERDDLWIVLVYATGVGLLSLATPVAVQALVNTVAFGALVFPVVVLALLLAGVLAFAGVLHALQMQVVETIQQRVFTRVALDLAHRLPRVRAEALDRSWGPELVNRFFDVLTVQKSASTFLLDGLSLVLSAGIGMLVLAFYHPALLAFDLVLVVSVSGLLWGLGRRGPYTAIRESKAKYRVAAWLEDLARSGATFRSPHGAEFASSRADELARAYLGARRESFKVVFRQYAGVLALQAIATGTLLGLGGWLVVARQLTLGQLVASELIVATVVSNLSKLGRKIDAYYDLLAAVDKLGHLADLPLERAHAARRSRAQWGPRRSSCKGCPTPTRGARRSRCRPSRSPRASVSRSSAARARASRRWPMSSTGCVRRARARSNSTAWTCVSSRRTRCGPASR